MRVLAVRNDPIYDLHADEHMRAGPKRWTHFLSGKPVSRQSPHACGGVHGS